jgi:hypothetical protein
MYFAVKEHRYDNPLLALRALDNHPNSMGSHRKSSSFGYEPNTQDEMIRSVSPMFRMGARGAGGGIYWL